MKVYQSKFRRLPGSNYKEIYSVALRIYKRIKSKTKRKPYIRSAYFKKDKIFLDYFWQHLRQKNLKDRFRRLRYYQCALDLVRNSRIEPTSKQNVDRSSEILHRFVGLTKDKEIFFVQISEDKKTDQKHFMSVFPLE